MASNWTKLRERLGPKREKRDKRLDYYERHIRELWLAGFQLADAEMEKVYSQLIGNPDEFGYLYFDERKSTYPSIAKTEPNEYGLYAYGTHDRSEHIDEAIERLAEIHAKDITERHAWLMPVIDDEEYTTWSFDVCVGTRSQVLEKLRAAVTLRNNTKATT